MKKDDIKTEIMNYMQTVETSYQEALKDNKSRFEKLKKEMLKEKSKHVNQAIEKSDLENLFVDCVEEVRRTVIKRRLKTEIVGKKQFGRVDTKEFETLEFE